MVKKYFLTRFGPFIEWTIATESVPVFKAELRRRLDETGPLSDGVPVCLDLVSTVYSSNCV